MRSIRLPAALFLLLLVLPACTSQAASEPSSESSASSTSAALSSSERIESDLSAGYDADSAGLGSEDPGIPAEIPERIPTTPFPEVEEGQLLVYEDFGLQQGAFHLVDPEDGQLGYVNVGQSDFWAPVGGTDDDLLGIAAVERFRPRGARGQIEAVVSSSTSAASRPARSCCRGCSTRPRAGTSARCPATAATCT